MKRFVAPAGFVIVAFVAWILFPGPFVHGVIIGCAAALGLLIGGLYAFSKVMARRHAGRGLQPPPLPTAAWDYAMALADLDGRPVSFADAAGSVVVLNFWATWCTPCIAELPSLQRLRSKTADLEVRFGFITREKPAVVRQFLEKRPMDLPMYVLSVEPPECFTGRAIPATFVVDKTGVIVLRHFGAAAWDAERVVAFIRGLAANPST